MERVVAGWKRARAAYELLHSVVEVTKDSTAELVDLPRCDPGHTGVSPGILPRCRLRGVRTKNRVDVVAAAHGAEGRSDWKREGLWTRWRECTAGMDWAI